MKILNEIKFLSPNLIIPHEEPSQTKLNELTFKIKKDGFVNHPILCTKLDEKIIILDGTHRFYALKHLDIKFIPIQLVQYNKMRIKLSSWCWQFRIDENFLKLLSEFNGNILSQTRNPRNYEVLIKSSESFILKFKNKVDFLRFLRSLNNIEYERVLKDNLVEGIIFPTLNHNFFLFLARNGYKIPSGITRFKIQNRILFLRVPLSILSDEYEIVKFKEQIKERKFRVYEESVLVFEN